MNYKGSVTGGINIPVLLGNTCLKRTYAWFPHSKKVNFVGIPTFNHERDETSFR